MRKPFKPINAEGATLLAYAFEELEGQCHILKDHVFLPDIDSDDLANCFVLFINHDTLIRTAAVDQERRSRQLLGLIRAIQKKLQPLCLTTSEHPAESWETLEKQHNLLNLAAQKSPCPLIHLNIPFKNSAPTRLEKEWSHLGRLMNMEAWVTYCQWLGAELEKVLHRFSLTMVEVYQFEGKLNDFCKEVKSVCLQQTQQVIRECTERLSEDQEINLVKKIEKQLIEARLILLRTTRLLQVRLEAIDEGIVKIRRSHPELSRLKCQVRVLRVLIAREMTQKRVLNRVMLHELLNHWLGVKTVVCGDEGVGHVAWEFALRQGLIGIENTLSPEQTLSLLLEWEERLREIDLEWSQRGGENFFFWMHTPAQSDEEQKKHERYLPLLKVQYSILSYLQTFERAIISANRVNKVGHLESHFKEDKTITSFIPAYIEVLEQDRIGQLVTWRTDGKRRLTDEGYALIASFFPTF